MSNFHITRKFFKNLFFTSIIIIFSIVSAATKNNEHTSIAIISKPFNSESPVIMFFWGPQINNHANSPALLEHDRTGNIVLGNIGADCFKVLINGALKSKKCKPMTKPVNIVYSSTKEKSLNLEKNSNDLAIQINDKNGFTYKRLISNHFLSAKYMANPEDFVSKGLVGNITTSGNTDAVSLENKNTIFFQLDESQSSCEVNKSSGQKVIINPGIYVGKQAIIISLNLREQYSTGNSIKIILPIDYFLKEDNSCFITPKGVLFITSTDNVKFHDLRSK